MTALLFRHGEPIRIRAGSKRVVIRFNFESQTIVTETFRCGRGRRRRA
jgi:hypothetical protein